MEANRVRVICSRYQNKAPQQRLPGERTVSTCVLKESSSGNRIRYAGTDQIFRGCQSIHKSTYENSKILKVSAIFQNIYVLSTKQYEQTHK